MVEFPIKHMKLISGNEAVIRSSLGIAKINEFCCHWKQIWHRPSNLQDFNSIRYW